MKRILILLSVCFGGILSAQNASPFLNYNKNGFGFATSDSAYTLNIRFRMHPLQDAEPGADEYQKRGGFGTGFL
jgi:hypothetical protein